MQRTTSEDQGWAALRSDRENPNVLYNPSFPTAVQKIEKCSAQGTTRTPNAVLSRICGSHPFNNSPSEIRHNDTISCYCTSEEHTTDFACLLLKFTKLRLIFLQLSKLLLKTPENIIHRTTKLLQACKLSLSTR